MVAQNQANYHAIKNLSRDLTRASILLAVSDEIPAPWIITFVLCHADVRTTFWWCDSMGGVIQC
jgi:hypothetical protein